MTADNPQTWDLPVAGDPLASDNPEDARLVVEQDIAAPPEQVWELWTTPAGISQWWAPDGFRTDVEELDLVPGGKLVFTMTTVDPEQIVVMQERGLPLTTRSRTTFLEVEPYVRLTYSLLVDFVPGHDPYDQLTRVDLTPSSNIPGGTHVTMHLDHMHNEEWTDRLVAGRTNELARLARLAQDTDS